MTGLDASADYNGVAYGMGRFVCVGTAGKSYYSTDARTWKPMTGLNAGVNCGAVTFGGDRFVCVGDAGKAYYSTDGEMWKAMTGLDTGVNYNAVAYGNRQNKDVFLCGSVDTNKIYESQDGLKWSYSNTYAADNNAVINDISYCNGTFMASGCRGVYLAVYIDRGYLLPWGNDINSVAIYNGYGIAYGKGVYVAIADANNTGHINVRKGNDGQWQINSYWTGGSFKGIAYGAEIFAVTGGRDNFYYSADGESWTAVSSGRTLASDRNIFNAIAYGGEY